MLPFLFPCPSRRSGRDIRSLALALALALRGGSSCRWSRRRWRRGRPSGITCFSFFRTWSIHLDVIFSTRAWFFRLWLNRRIGVFFDRQERLGGDLQSGSAEDELLPSYSRFRENLLACFPHYRFHLQLGPLYLVSACTLQRPSSINPIPVS